ncbi:MAG: DUF5986 family protein [Desulfosporosinus sp.]|nr:DUF5986 family protein [Desulfosporosinus sp.]
MKSSIKEMSINASDEFINTIAKCLVDAVGDDIKEDVELHKLVTQNGTKGRIWDFLNRNICKSFSKSDIIANPTKRGAWELVPVFDRNTGTIYSLMREQRFSTLKKELPKRRIANYVDALVGSLNANLIAPHHQSSLFPSLTKKFNSKKLQEIVQKILYDLGIPNNLVKRHALILFKSSNYELSTIRCCVVNSNLDIVEEADWSNYIKTNESAVADKITDKTSAYVDPTAGLKFTQKAKDKMNQKTPAKDKSKEKKKKTDDNS